MLTPVFSAIFGRIFLKENFGNFEILALCFSILSLVFLFRPDEWFEAYEMKTDLEKELD